ncbi:MAG: hypothetical protein Q9220_001454 [cf. Caloplaca sp. 1 TL-2023]
MWDIGLSVVVIGYSIIAASFFVIVQSSNVYPQLLLGRLFFSLGASCVSTMVTAIMPTMVSEAPLDGNQGQDADSNSHMKTSKSRHTRLAGFVGLFTGTGALFALGILLPIPPRLQGTGVRPRDALADTYYIAGAIAVVVATVGYLGLGPGNDKSVLKRDSAKSGPFTWRGSNFFSFLPQALRVGFTQPSFCLGFFASFVARSASVGIALFIPLFVNASLCDRPAQNVGDIKAHCRKAYVIAAQLTGVSQLFALVFAPVFGYLPRSRSRFHVPLLLAALCGMVGYVGFTQLDISKPSPISFVMVALLGVSQIGIIVNGLSLLSSFVMDDKLPASPRIRRGSSSSSSHGEAQEGTTLLPTTSMREGKYERLKGTFAGVYSLAGSLAILILTMLGGQLFDRLGPASPFYLLAGFNCALLVAVCICAVFEES